MTNKLWRFVVVAPTVFFAGCGDTVIQPPTAPAQVLSPAVQITGFSSSIQNRTIGVGQEFSVSWITEEANLVYFSFIGGYPIVCRKRGVVSSSGCTTCVARTTGSFNLVLEATGFDGIGGQMTISSVLRNLEAISKPVPQAISSLIVCPD